MFLSKRAVEAIVGSVRVCSEAALRQAMAVEALRDRALALEVVLVVVLRDMRCFLVLIHRAEAREVMLNAYWACVRGPFGSLALWVLGVGGFALRCARRQGD